MKRILSVFLCFVMVFSVFASAGITVNAASATNALTVYNSGVENGRITYTLSLVGGIKIEGAVVAFEYDPLVLKVVEADGVYSVDDDGNKIYNVNGEYVSGQSVINDKAYSIGYVNSDSFNVGADGKQFMSITFECIDAERPVTTVGISCEELKSDLYVIEKSADKSEKLVLSETISTLETVKLSAATLEEDGINITWEEAAGADSYKIYRKTAETVWVLLSTQLVGVCSFLDTTAESGVIYSYTVAASNESGDGTYNYSGVSCLYLAKPVITKIANAVGGVELCWKDVGGATMYFINRKASGSTEFSRIATVKAGVETFTDTTVTSLTGYEYTITAICGSVVTADGISGSTYYVKAPSIESIENFTDYISLKWNSVEGATSYAVFKKLAGDTAFSQVYTASATAVLSYNDSSVTTGQNYVYGVKAITAGGESAMRESAALARVPLVEKVETELCSAGVDISWTDCNGVDGYIIYRKMSTVTAWSELTKVGATTLQFKDITPQSGREYDYAVAAYIATTEGIKTQAENKVFYLKTPSAPVLTNVEDGIKVSWAPSANSASYDVYRKIVGKTDFEKVQTINSASITNFVDANVVDGNTYIYAVKASAPKGSSFISEESKALLRLTSPLITKMVSTNDGITLTWNEISSADGYKIYRKSTGAWQSVGTVTPAGICTYTDKSAVSGNKYYYSVVSFFGDDESSIDGVDNTIGVLFVKGTSKVTLSNSTSGITVKWEKADGAVKYGICRRASVYEEWQQLYVTADGTVLSYVDKAVKSGSEYQYLIRTYSDSSTYIATESGTLKCLACPTVKAANAYSGVKVVWNKISGAEKYRIYRKAVGDTSWTVINDVTALTYTDKTAKSGKTYYYTVAAFSGSTRSAYKAVKLKYIASPVVNYISNSGSGVSLKWAKIGGATKYYIYRKTSAGAKWKNIGSASTSSYIDKTAKSGTSYIYTIRAYDGSVLSSFNSNGWKIKFLATPKLGSAVSSKSGITFKWSAVTGASGYIVYRKTGTGSWVQLAKISGKSKVAYLDKSAKKGVTYKYTVRAYSGSYKSSYYSGISCKDKY